VSTAFFPSQLAAVSLGLESTYGTAVSPTYSIPVSAWGPSDSHTPIGDAAWQGPPATTFGHEPGPLAGAHQLAAPVYADTVGFPLAGLLGDVTTTTGSPNTHAMSLLTTGDLQPPSYTLYGADGLDCLRYAGFRFTDCTLSGGDTGFAWTADGVSLDSTVVSAPTTNFTGLAPIPSWTGVVQLGGVTDLQTLSATVAITRSVVAQRNTDGSRVPWLQRAAEITVTGSVAVAMRDDTYRAAFVAGTPSSVDVTYSYGSGASAQQVKLHCSSVVFTKAARSYGSNWVELDLEWVADANAADAGSSGGKSPIKATVKNTVASGVYA